MPTPDSKLIAFVGRSASIGGARIKTANYTADVNDSGMLLSFNSSSAITLTLPATPPNFRWCIAVENIGTGVLTVNRNGLTIDGAAANLTLNQNAGTWIFTDGSNYLTERGAGTGGATSPLTTKGDIWGFDSANNRIPVGSNGQVLTADSSQTLGVKWASLLLRKYEQSFSQQTQVVITHNLATLDVETQVFAIPDCFFGALMGAFTDASGNVVAPVRIGNGPVTLVVPAGATQLQLGFNDSSWFDNLGSWVINVNGSNYTVPATSQPWVTTGGINGSYPLSVNDGTAPVVVSGFTAGQIAVVQYVSGLTTPGGGYSTIYDANGGPSGFTYGGLPNPGGYTSPAPCMKVDPELCGAADLNNVVVTFAAPFSGKVVVVG